MIAAKDNPRGTYTLAAGYVIDKDYKIGRRHPGITAKLIDLMQVASIRIGAVSPP